YLASPAVEHPGRAGVRAADLAAHAAVAIFCKTDRCAGDRKPSPHRHRSAGAGERRLSHHVRDRIRLLALGCELGGVPVPDPACGEDVADGARGTTDSSRRSKNKHLWLDRHPNSAGGNRTTFLMARPPHPHIQRALAAMADMGLLE